MTGIPIADFFVFYVQPVAITIMFGLLIYLQATEVLAARRRAKREREQQVH
jgi:hypothetical protein